MRFLKEYVHDVSATLVLWHIATSGWSVNARAVAFGIVASVVLGSRAAFLKAVGA